MTQDEIIEMAREIYGTLATEQEIRFAKLVAAKEQKKWQDQTAVEIHEAVLEEREACGEAAMKAAEKAVDVAMKLEREACAKVAETSFGVIGSTIAKAIRARGEA
jgi:uncharacterized protein involved in type VI secretion and phage assembly